MTSQCAAFSNCGACKHSARTGVLPHRMGSGTTSATPLARRRTNLARKRAIATPHATAVQNVDKGVSDIYNVFNDSNIKVYRASDGTEVVTSSLWTGSDRAIVVLGRTFGCPFCQEHAQQIARDVLPVMRSTAQRAFAFVGMGTPETAAKFSELTSLPADVVYADPSGALYGALNTVNDFRSNWLDVRTPLAIAQRVAAGRGGDMVAAWRSWKPWMPPKLGQAQVQGGTFVFEGSACKWVHYDPAPAAHVNTDVLLQLIHCDDVTAVPVPHS